MSFHRGGGSVQINFTREGYGCFVDHHRSVIAISVNLLVLTEVKPQLCMLTWISFEVVYEMSNHDLISVFLFRSGCSSISNKRKFVSEIVGSSQSNS